jgi:hypothetical protein
MEAGLSQGNGNMPSHASQTRLFAISVRSPERTRAHGSFLSPRARSARTGCAGAGGTHGGTTRVPSCAVHRAVASRYFMRGALASQSRSRNRMSPALRWPSSARRRRRASSYVGQSRYTGVAMLCSVRQTTMDEVAPRGVDITALW